MVPNVLRRFSVPRPGWPTPQTTTRHAVVGGTVALVAAAVGFVFRFGSNAPFQDEWDLLPPLAGRPVDWSSVYAYHNEHRYLLAKAIWSALLIATNFEFRTGMVLTVLLHAAAAAVMLRLARRARGRWHLADLAVPVLLLNWGHYFNFLMAYQLAFGLILVCSVGLLWAASHAEPGREGRTGLWAGAWLIAAVQNGGFGLAAAPPVAVWVAYLAGRAWRTDGWKAIRLFLPLIAVAGYIGWTALNQPASYLVKVRPGPLELVEIVCGYCGCGLGSWMFFTRYHPLPSAAAGLFYLYVTAVAVRAFVRHPAERPRVGGYLAVLAGFFVTAGGIAWSRGGAWAPHYLTTSCVGLCAAWLILLRYGPPIGRVGRGLVLVGAGAVLVVNARFGYREGLTQRNYFKEMLTDLAAGVPPMFVSGKYNCRWYSTTTAGRIFVAFQARGVRGYEAVVPDPPHVVVPVPIAATMEAWQAVGPPTPVAVPDAPGRAFGLRLIVDNLKLEEWAAWELTWTAADGRRRRAVAHPPNMVSDHHPVLFWVDGPARDVTLVTLCPTRGYVIRSAEWIVPSP